VDNEHASYHVLRVVMLAFIKGFRLHWQSRWRGAQFQNMSGPPSRKLTRLAGKG